MEDRSFTVLDIFVALAKWWALLVFAPIAVGLGVLLLTRLSPHAYQARVTVDAPTSAVDYIATVPFLEKAVSPPINGMTMMQVQSAISVTKAAGDVSEVSVTTAKKGDAAMILSKIVEHANSLPALDRQRQHLVAGIRAGAAAEKTLQAALDQLSVDYRAAAKSGANTTKEWGPEAYARSVDALRTEISQQETANEDLRAQLKWYPSGKVIGNAGHETVLRGGNKLIVVASFFATGLLCLLWVAIWAAVELTFRERPAFAGKA